MRFKAAVAADIRAADAVIVPLRADGALPATLPRALRGLAERTARAAGTQRLYGIVSQFGASGRLVLVGVGQAEHLSPERLRNAAAAGVRSLWGSRTRRIVVVADEHLGADAAVAACVEGVIVAMWRPEAHRSRPETLPPLGTVGILCGGGVSRRAIARAEAIGEAVNLTRRLANEPGNLMTPSALAEEARAVAERGGLACEVLDERRCRALGMHAYLSVACGSLQPPRFVVLRYHGRPGKGYDLGLVGKGITFDSGGISIKPSSDMHKMKADMTGAAAVIATMGALARLRPAVNVVAAAPCTENLPGGSASKPGDVFTSMSGKTVEVLNTDAEGRLVLMDALTYVQRQGAKRVVDIATLTGAIHVALGEHFSGLFGKPDAFVAQVRETASAAGDHLWPMPLTDAFREEVRSDIADLRNSAGRFGGASKAAAFLDAVVDAGVEWAHLDIASQDWSDRDRPYAPKGPQAPGLRTLIALAESAAP